MTTPRRGSQQAPSELPKRSRLDGRSGGPTVVGGAPRRGRVEAMSETTRSSARRAHDLPLVAAARGASPERRPVWFMRQAGRSLPEYRAIRADHGMLESCFDPALVREITMQPVRRHDVDAAIFFSDIVVPLRLAGVDVEIQPGVGPVLGRAVRTADDVAALPVLED